MEVLISVSVPRKQLARARVEHCDRTVGYMVGSNFRSFTPRSAKRLRGRHLSGKIIFNLIEVASVILVFFFVLALMLLTSGRGWTGCLLPVWDVARSSPLLFFSQPVPATHTAWHKRREFPVGIKFGIFFVFLLRFSASVFSSLSLQSHQLHSHTAALPLALLLYCHLPSHPLGLPSIEASYSAAVP